MSGIAQLFNCSMTTANRIKASGMKKWFCFFLSVFCEICEVFPLFRRFLCNLCISVGC
ncbi:MAG: DUF3853 family protein [Proteiniphilum sp.]|nr:DUF3853 family protein [Proteiniphilum sp.]